MFCDVIKVSHDNSTLRVLYNKKAPRARSAVKIMEVVQSFRNLSSGANSKILLLAVSQ
jgi:hypothetical protein